MAYFIFNVMAGEATRAIDLLRHGLWAVGVDEPHHDALAAGDRALVYLAGPERKFIGRAELGSAVHDWTAEEALVVAATSLAGVSLAGFEEWDPPVPMASVLSRIDQSAGARADFEVGVVQITRVEYETALAVAGDRSIPTA